MNRLTWQDPAHISRTYNVIWNALARFLQIGLQFLFVPIYLHLLGADAFALLVLNATVMATLAFVDQFVSAIMLRELGAHNGNPTRTARIWNLFNSLERVSFVCALVIIFLAPFAGPLLVSQWTTGNSLDARTISIAMALMGISIAVQLPGMFYASGLIGLQRQGLLSIIRIVWLPAYYGIGALLLVFAERNIILLLCWQAFAFALLSVVLRLVLIRAMPTTTSDYRRDPAVLKQVWQFGLASLLFAVTTITVTQIDKFIVASNTPSPERFAAYGLAFSLAAQTLAALSGAFFTAVQPALTGLYANGNKADLHHAYRRWTQLIMIASVLAAGVLFIILSPLVDIWLGAQSPLGPHIKQLLPIILAATLLNAAIITPMILMFAIERLSVMNLINVLAIISALLFLPLCLQRWGLVSGAAFFLLVNVAYLLIATPIIHRAVFQQGYMTWLLRDVIVPLIIGTAVFLGATLWIGHSLPFVEACVLATTCAILCLGMMMACLPQGRQQLLRSICFMLGRNKSVSP